MTYETRQKKQSQFTSDSTIGLTDTWVRVKSGINKKATISDLLDKVAEVYGASARVYETESELVASDISIGELAIVKENRYALYNISNAAAGTYDVSITSGLTAVRKGNLEENNVADYVELRALSILGLVDGMPIEVTDAGISGTFYLRNSVAHGLTDNGGTIIVIDADWYAERGDTIVLTPKMFECAMNGTTDDTVGWNLLLDYAGANECIIDCLDLPMLLSSTKSFAPTVKQNWKRVNIVNGTTWTDQYRLTISTDIEFMCDSLTMDAGRDTKTGNEPWTVFTSFGGVDSIKPTTGVFLKFSFAGRTKDIIFDRINVTNFHGDVVIEVDNNHAVFTADDVYFENCSNKQIHVFQGIDGGDQPDLGITYINNITTRDCGILPAAFNVDAASSVRADNYAPQGAFGMIVSFGRFILGNMFAHNYGSTAVTFDRNISASFDNIQVVHTDGNAFNNNPSGAVWNEFCDVCVGGNVEVKVSARDSRETAIDNSLLQIALSTNQRMVIDNVILETEAGANINKTIRGSLTTGSELFINGGSVIDADSNYSVRLLNGASTLSKIISITDLNCTGAPCEISDSSKIVLTNFSTDGTLTCKGNNIAIGDVIHKNVTSGTRSISGSSGNILISGGKTTGNMAVTSLFSSSFNRCRVVGGYYNTGNVTLTGGKEAYMSGVTTDRAVEFRDVVTATANGNLLKTTAGETILSATPTSAGICVHASFTGNSLQVKTGTVGAGYVNISTNVGSGAGNRIDNQNDKITVAWV